MHTAPAVGRHRFIKFAHNKSLIFVPITYLLDILIVLAKLLITLSFESAKLNKIILFNKHAKINRKKMNEYSSDALTVDMI